MIKKHRVSCTLILTLLVVVMALALLPSTFLGLEIAWADSVTKNIPVGDTPTGVAFDSATATLT